MNFAANRRNSPKKKKIFLAICYGNLWCAWKARNDVWFNKMHVNSSKLVDNMISLVFSLMKHRGNLVIVNGKFGLFPLLTLCKLLFYARSFFF